METKSVDEIIDAKVEITEDKLSEKHYSLKLHMNAGITLTLSACLTDKKLEIFKDAFSDGKDVSKWMRQVMPTTSYLINIDNVCMVEISELIVEKKEVDTESAKSPEKHDKENNDSAN